MAASINRKIAGIYDQRRLAAELARDRLVEQAYSKWPDLRALDRAIASAGADLLLEAIEPGRPRQADLSLQKRRLQRTRLLEQIGLAADFDQVRYTCSLCQDTGWMGGRTDHQRCSCYRSILIPMLSEQANLSHLAGQTFQAFDETLFQDQPDPVRYQSELSPRQQIKGLRRACEQFVRQFEQPETRNLLFVGKPGTGKTYLMACVAHSLLDLGHSVYYLSAPQLFDQLQEHRTLLASFNPDNTRMERSDALQDILQSCDLLLIDDLGTEAGAAARYADLLGVIDSRTQPGLKTIISTNADPASLRDQYDERLLSRLVGGFAVYRFFGEDVRLQLNRRRRP
jgi:DNA replication protein DnaC